MQQAAGIVVSWVRLPLVPTWVPVGASVALLSIQFPVNVPGKTLENTLVLGL